MTRWWLSCRDRRVAQDAQFLSFIHGLLEQKDMTAALGLQARMNRGLLQADAFFDALTDGAAHVEVYFLLLLNL